MPFTPQYDIIYADPPWEFRVWSKKGAGRTAAAHYPTMKTADIAALPIKDLAAPKCSLFIWACWPNLKDLFTVLDGWGFEYKTLAFIWIKTIPRTGTQQMFVPLGEHMGLHTGMGHWTRANSEPCFLATRGTPKRIKADVQQVLMAPVREHSRKPDETYGRIERLMGKLSRVELFARQRWDGWDAWGNQVDDPIQLIAG